eukprot:7517439-Lingulodinium_polyedra.AAC.1
MHKFQTITVNLHTGLRPGFLNLLVAAGVPAALARPALQVRGTTRAPAPHAWLHVQQITQP